jgi:heme A synthase
MADVPLTRPVPRWLHAWAVLTVVATAVLLAIGSLVTTFRFGMADQVWPTTPWELFLSGQAYRLDYLVEHSHRLAGYVVGCCAIVLAVGLWMRAPTRSLRWLGVAGLLAVIVQGLLGGFRVRLNELAGTDLAAFHGLFAQMVFSLLVCLAVLTAAPRPGPPIPAGDLRRLRRLSLALLGLVFLQIIWGVLIRHNPGGLNQRAHLATAFAVVAVAAWFIRTAHATPAVRARMRTAGAVLVGLLVLQVLLGVEAWMGKFATGILPELQVVTPGQAGVRSAHVLVGTGLLATSVVLALLACRPAVAATWPGPDLATDRVPEDQPLVAANGARQRGGLA